MSDAQLSKTLNLIRENPAFVWTEAANGSELVLSSPDVVPADSGFCWVAARVRLASGHELDGVLVVDTGAGGELRAAYVFDDSWIDLASPPTGYEHQPVHPFDFDLRIPLEVDYRR